MKIWAVVVALLYFALLVIITIPVIVSLFPEAASEELLDIYKCKPYWIVVSVMVVCQLSLLLISVPKPTEWQTPRRHIWWSLLLTGLLFGIVVMGACLSVIEVLSGEDFTTPAPFYASIGIALMSWVLWCVVFRSVARNDPSKLVDTLCKRLYHGSILELLIAIPSHIFVRHRGYCCAGVYTFMGIAAGVTIMLFAFGPCLLILFHDRIYKKK